MTTDIAPFASPIDALSLMHNALRGEQWFVPVLQHVAFATKHIYHSDMEPYSLLDRVRAMELYEEALELLHA